MRRKRDRRDLLAEIEARYPNVTTEELLKIPANERQRLATEHLARRQAAFDRLQAEP